MTSKSAHQINEGKKHHQFYTTTSYWREQENQWSRNHFHKEHHEFASSGVWRDSIPGPGAYSPLALKPTGQASQLKKAVYSAKSFAAGELQLSTASLGSSCFKKAYQTKKDAWWGPPGFSGERTKSATNRLHPQNCNEIPYPVSICSCVAVAAAPEKLKCDLCKVRLQPDEDASHRNVCPRAPVRCENCDLEVERQNADRHNDLDCDMRQFQCNWCQTLVARGKWAEHRDSISRNGCQQRPVRCEWCFATVTSEAYDSHQEDCIKRPHECPYCKDLQPFKIFKNHTEACPMRPVICRFCRSNLSFAEARNHRLVCTHRPQICKLCSATVEKADHLKHESGCHLIRVAKILAPVLKIQALGVSAEKLPPPHLGLPVGTTNYQKVQRTFVVPFGQRLIKVDKKGQVGAAGAFPGDFVYKIRIVQGIERGDSLVSEEETTTLDNFAKIVNQIRPGDAVTFFINRPARPLPDVELIKIKNIAELFAESSKVEVNFFALGYWYNPRDESQKRNYTQDEIARIIRLSKGELNESDYESIKAAPFWLEHGQAWQGIEGPTGLTGTHKGRYSIVSSKTEMELGMLKRAMSGNGPDLKRIMSASSSYRRESIDRPYTRG